ncbi:MAG: hypothetical protein AB7I33_02090 [Gemmatimonadales bacterium]
MISNLELFPRPASQEDAIDYAPFLTRARAAREHGEDAAARVALGAYLVARLVARQLALGDTEDELEGFRWQLDSTRRFLRDLPDGQPEVAHLAGVLEAVTSDPGVRATAMRMALTAYAYYLEHESRLDEALDVLQLSAGTYSVGIPEVEATTYGLFVGRLNRMLARWDDANRGYRVAESAGTVIQDRPAVLLAHIGQANVLRGQGNLPSARERLEAVIREARGDELTEVAGRAWFDLAVVFSRQGQVVDELHAQYMALKLLRDPVQRTRVLGDMGVSLRRLGAYDASRRSFQLVLSSDASVVIRTNAILELMELESAVGNRLAFERYRQEARFFEDRMPPSMAIDYRYKVGLGLVRFGKEVRARAMLREALSLSEEHRLNEWYFRVDRVLRNLGVCVEGVAETTTTDAVEAPVVAEVSAGLLELATAAAS